MTTTAPRAAGALPPGARPWLQEGPGCRGVWRMMRTRVLGPGVEQQTPWWGSLGAPLAGPRPRGAQALQARSSMLASPHPLAPLLLRGTVPVQLLLASLLPLPRKCSAAWKLMMHCLQAPWQPEERCRAGGGWPYQGPSQVGLAVPPLLCPLVPCCPKARGMPLPLAVGTGPRPPPAPALHQGPPPPRSSPGVPLPGP